MHSEIKEIRSSMQPLAKIAVLRMIRTSVAISCQQNPVRKNNTATRIIWSELRLKSMKKSILVDLLLRPVAGWHHSRSQSAPIVMVARDCKMTLSCRHNLLWSRMMGMRMLFSRRMMKKMRVTFLPDKCLKTSTVSANLTCTMEWRLALDCPWDLYALDSIDPSIGPMRLAPVQCSVPCFSQHRI
ncbi:uncharacterized protein LOC120712552 isoform X5 [Panicum virgatum]|uniref:uncharacterized protein LOC120712552 isoform X5 n=1 Tax=Panicum virgatum TaxID=38727 RepID=UPI0019D6937A|nr:uncharacterized protein LOC120712552 isoform X5 [Panicum virgatum]